MKLRNRSPLVLGLLASTLSAAPAVAFERVQPPDLAVGQRAALSGSLSSTAYGPSDVSRGGFTVPTPFAAPTDRGPTLASFFPSYSPDNGISPWGMGFSASLQLTRWRAAGSLQYDFGKGDQITGPFGQMTRGADGDWYPVGLTTPVRIVAGANDTMIAYHPDGSVWTFGGAARIASGRGTYAWYLTQVKDAIGHTTTLTWTTNPTGNLFLSEVDYGGRATPQYKVTFAYEAVSTTDAGGNVIPKFVDYRSGAPIALDQRVTQVTVLARNAASGGFVERWHYTLSYIEETNGAAFYLAQVQQTFASGQQPPPITYTYNFKGTNYASSTASEVPQLTALFTQLGVTEDILQPSRAAVIDADGDGNSDLELDDGARTLVYQQGSGTASDPVRFTTAPLPPSTTPACTTPGQTGCIYAGCLPPVDGVTIASPRMLSQLNPTDTQVAVVDFLYDSTSDQTAISVCARDGTRSSMQSVPTEWDQSTSVRFVDLDSDHMPDLVRVAYGHYDVLPNVSTPGTATTNAAWGTPVSGPLGDSTGSPFTADDIWVADASGDGIPDLVGLWGDAIEVWHGLGNDQFDPIAKELRFVDRTGQPFTGLSSYQLVPADLNKDGLQDYFVTNPDGDGGGRFIRYFTNLGGKLVEVPVAALDQIPFTASAPVIATLDGSGNLAVTYTDGGHAYSVPLDGPETGLMATADDGKGTVLSFQYARGPASPGVRHRSVLLASMTQEGSGYDPISYSYQYASPVTHSLGHFLVGYGAVTREEGELPAAPLGANVMTFLNSDNFSGLLATGAHTDVRFPTVKKIESRTYADQAFQGIPYKRLAASSTGWATLDGKTQAVDTTTYDAYVADFCPSHTTLKTANHGTLVTQTTRANPANLTNALHCLESDVVQTGTHTDTTLNFKQETVIARNAAGRITQVSLPGTNGTLVQQQVTYDPDNDPMAIVVPGKGSTSLAYDPSTKLPLSITSPDGVVTKIASRDPVTDGVKDVLTSRGAASWNDQASYDGMERLATRWSDVDGSSASAPRERYAYTYASTNHPATVTVGTLVDVATGVVRSRTELYTAAEEKIGTALLGDAGWVMDGFTARSRAHAESDRFQVVTQPASTSFASIEYASLLVGPDGAAPPLVSRKESSTFGLDEATQDNLHLDVTKTTTTSIAVSTGQVSQKTLVNGANATTSVLDPSGKLHLKYVDEAGTTYAYNYDALGRLRGVALPDGAHHVVTYDNYGRVSTIKRDGIALVTDAFTTVGASTTDLVASRTFASAPTDGSASTKLRTIAWTYDGSGRKRVETHTDVPSAATKTFTFFYDGATPSAPTTSTQRGLLTAVTGTGYTKLLGYRADGKLVHRELTLNGFRTIDTDTTYRPDATVMDQTNTVKDATGKVLTTSAHHQDVDAYGRPSSMTENGAPLLTTTYDPLGRPNVASFATGDAVSFAYDPLTRDPVGFDETRAAVGSWPGVASTRIKKNDRGFIGSEVLGIGPSKVARTYGYSAQGFLTQSVDGVAQ